MDITVNKKQLNTDPIRALLMQGESLVDNIVFKLPLDYEGILLSGLEFSISATNDASEVTTTKVLTKTVTETGVDVEWPVGADFTAVPGELKLTLSGADESGDVIYKCYGEPIYVRKDPS